MTGLVRLETNITSVKQVNRFYHKHVHVEVKTFLNDMFLAMDLTFLNALDFRASITW